MKQSFMTLDPGNTTGYAYFLHNVPQLWGTIPYKDIELYLLNRQAMLQPDFVIAERALSPGIGQTSLINKDVMATIERIFPRVRWVLPGHWKPMFIFGELRNRFTISAGLNSADDRAKDWKQMTTHERDAIGIGYYALTYKESLLCD